MVDAVTRSFQVTWWLSKSWHWWKALHYCTEATYHAGSWQAKHVANTFLIFFIVLIYASESNVLPLCITSRRIMPLQFQNTMTISFQADGEHQGTTLFLLLHPSLVLSSNLQCSYRMQHFHNIAEPFMDVPHCFFHCNKELYHSMLFVMTITGRLHFEELQHRCHVRNLYKFVHRMRKVQMCANWNNSFLALLLTEKKIVGHYFLGNLCTYTCWKCFNLTGPPSDTFYKDYNC